jgi:hypothetical protein
VATKYKVERMTKGLGQIRAGEIPVKLRVVVAPSAFREPVIERRVEVTDWREGIDIADIDFRETFITEKEAAQIRAQRLAAMKEILEEHGYNVEPAESSGEPEE